MSTPKPRRRSTADDKIEAQRKIIRRSLDEITVAVESAMRDANLHSAINMVVPSRHSLVTIAGPSNLPPEEWLRMSAIVCQVLEQKLGTKELRGRPLSRATVNVMMDDFDVSHE